MRFGREAIFHFLAQVLRSAAGFAATFFIARYLGAAELGTYSQVLALLFWIKLPGNSISTAVSKRVSEQSVPRGFVLTGLAIVLAYAGVVGVVLIAFEQYVNSYAGIEVAGALVLLVATNLSSDVMKNALVGARRVALSGWLWSIEQVVRLGLQVAFVLLGYYVIGLVFGHLISLAIFAGIGAILIRDRLTLPTRTAVTELRLFAQYSWLGNLKSVALNWMDLLVLGFFVASDLVGIYQAAWTLSSFLALAGGSISRTLFPELSSLGVEENYERASELLNEALVFTGVFLIPGIFGALVVGERVLRIYRPEFSAGAVVLVVLIAARTCHSFGSQILNTLNGLDYPEIAFRVNGIFLATNLVLNVALVYQFGWLGAATATLASSVVYILAGWRYLTGVIGSFKFPFREVLAELLASGVMVVVILVILPYIPAGNYVTIAVVLFGAGIYGVTLLIVSRRIRTKILSLLPMAQG